MIMMEFFRAFLETEDGKIMFLLAVICTAMVIDFLSGTLAARVNPNIKFESGKGINGILRKIASITLLVFFIPVSVLIPGGTGTALLYILYLGYLIMEIQSIFENYETMGTKTDLFKRFMESFKKKESEE